MWRVWEGWGARSLTRRQSGRRAAETRNPGAAGRQSASHVRLPCPGQLPAHAGRWAPRSAPLRGLPEDDDEVRRSADMSRAH